MRILLAILAVLATAGCGSHNFSDSGPSTELLSGATAAAGSRIAPAGGPYSYRVPAHWHSISRFSLTGAGAAATRSLFATRGAVRGAVSIIGLVIVFYSIFSFTRGLQRVYIDIWGLTPQKFEAMLRRATWILGFVVYTSVLTPIQDYDRDHHIPYMYATGVLVLGTVFWIWTPYILLGRRIAWRRLLPTGLITSAGIAIYTIGSALYLPTIFTHNAERYGLIGIAFGLVTWLFAYSGVVIACAVVAHSWDVHHNPDDLIIPTADSSP